MENNYFLNGIYFKNKGFFLKKVKVVSKKIKLIGEIKNYIRTE